VFVSSDLVVLWGEIIGVEMEKITTSKFLNAITENYNEEMMQPGESNTSSEMCISFTLSIKRFGSARFICF